MKAIKVIVICLSMLTLLQSSALAYDGLVTGRLKVVLVKNNMESQRLVLQLEGLPELCGTGTPNVAILPSTAPAFNAILSVALSAYVSGKPLMLISNMEGSQCMIQQVRLDTDY